MGPMGEQQQPQQMPDIDRENYIEEQQLISYRNRRTDTNRGVANNRDSVTSDHAISDTDVVVGDEEYMEDEDSEYEYEYKYETDDEDMGKHDKSDVLTKENDDTHDASEDSKEDTDVEFEYEYEYETDNHDIRDQESQPAVERENGDTDKGREDADTEYARSMQLIALLVQENRTKETKKTDTDDDDSQETGTMIDVSQQNQPPPAAAAVNRTTEILQYVAQQDGKVKVPYISPLFQTMNPPNENNGMALGPMGKAWQLVDQLLALEGKFRNEYPVLQGKLESLAVHDVKFRVCDFICQQKDFEKVNKPTKIDIGYHFTTTDNMRSIEQMGLLTKPDREKEEIRSKHNGSSLGEGVYTANDTIYAAGGGYGNEGFLVARLRGCDDVDSVISGTVVVLKASSQCLALLRFKRALLTTPAGPEALQKVHEGLQSLMNYIMCPCEC